MIKSQYVSWFRPFALAFLAALTLATAEARPLNTDDTGTAQAGAWEIEGGVDYVRDGDAEAFALTPVFAYGVTPRLQLDIGCDYLMEYGVGGEPDVESLRPSLQLKSRFWESDAQGLSLGAAASIGHHVHVRGLRGDLDQSGHLRLLLTQVAGAVEFDVNVGYDFSGGWGDGDDAFMASAGLRHAVTGTVTLLGEIFSSIPDRGGKTSSMLAIGGKIDAGNGWTFDALIGTGIDSAAPSVRVVLGFVRAL